MKWTIEWMEFMGIISFELYWRRAKR